MPTRMRAAAAVLAAVLIPSVAAACLWDHDTLRMERSKFPTVLELITGKFLRHSPEFYEWRVRDRQKRLEADPSNLALSDDLGVAFDKTGRHEDAIRTAEAALRLQPNRYETEANLGTFLIHAGRLEDGLPHIGRAIQINPDAHFGREKYQKYLVEYVISRRQGGKTKLPLGKMHGPDDKMPDEKPGTLAERDFASFLEANGEHVRRDVAARQAAVKGLLGIMKFGNYDSPVVLESLAVLLAHQHTGPEGDAKQLAARAYLKAGYEVKDEGAKADYREMAKSILSMQRRSGTDEPLSLEQVETEFQKELAEAREWYAELREKELSWIRDGKDPEAEFDRLYDEEPAVTDSEPFKFADWIGRPRVRLYAVVGLFAVAVFACGGYFLLLLRRSRRPAPNV